MSSFHPHHHPEQRQPEGSTRSVAAGTVPHSSESPVQLDEQDTPTPPTPTPARPVAAAAGQGASVSQLLLAPSHLYHVSSAESVKGSSNDRSETTNFVNKPQQQGLASFGPAHASVFSQQGSTSSLGQHYIAMSQERPAHTLQRGASAGSSQGFKCPNCAKVFAREDLLRRHISREARAQSQPSLDRQKSCQECARSKARCDLEVPSCGRCKVRGKVCVYGARSGNPNVRRSFRETQEPGATDWPGTPPVGAGSQWHGPQEYNNHFGRADSKSTDEYESSDESRNWSESFQQYRPARALSTSSTSSGSFDPHHGQHGFDTGYSSDFHVAAPRSESPHSYPSTMRIPQPANQASQLARGFAQSGAKTNIDTSVPSTSTLGVNDDEGEVTPISRPNVAPMTSGYNVMGPPLLTPTRYRDASGNFVNSLWDRSPVFNETAVNAGTSQKPQPPRLLTGARMPKPQDGQGGELASSRPLFSAQLDLSGWLEEPVIPSPLYRMGPSLSALGPGPTHASLLPPTPTSNGATVEALKNALAVNPPLPSALTSDRRNSVNHNSSSDTVMEHRTHQDGGDVKLDQNSNETHVAAKQWWAHSTGKLQNEVDMQGVAQACAGHFTIYPALMVLPDPTSPVPPLFHRPWLAHSRLLTPTSLARTRVLLAGYHVKLPSSEGMVWQMIAMEANSIVSSFEQLIGASDLEVFSSTAALWFLIILLLMSSDPSSGANIPESLVDSSLIGLSHLSRLLSQRIKACEERRKTMTQPISYLDWGFEETMKRTLFASYSLLVLQRFRQTSTEIQSQLAGIDLILDVPLPATALEFEAGDELQWRACHHVQISDSCPGGLPKSITMRDLFNARDADGKEESRKTVTSYFDRHDDFTNVCLSVAFALDRGIP